MVVGLAGFLLLRIHKPLTMLWAFLYVPISYLAMAFWLILFSMTIGIPK